MDKKQVSFRIEPSIIKDLKYLALENDKTLTNLFVEAIDDLFVKYGKKKRKKTIQTGLFRNDEL
jgi:mRNA-degrading endonuclease RelE of RelBE toxin-antitoxin system